MYTAGSADIKQLSINNTVLHYQEQGSGSTLIWVHGSLSDYRMWEAQVKFFSAQYHVFAYSRRHAYPNQSDDEAASSAVALHVHDLAALIETMHKAPVHIIGHSYGGYIALLTTIQFPGLVKSLVLAEPPVMPLLKNSAKGKALLADFESNIFYPAGAAFKSGNNEEAIKIFLNGVLNAEGIYEQLPKEVQQQVMDNVPELKAMLTADSLSNVFPDLSCETIKKIHVPVLLLTGELSPRFLTLITDELAACLPLAECVQIPGASHEMEMDNPEVFNEAIQKFIEVHS